MQVACRAHKRRSDATAVENARKNVDASAGSCQAETAAARGRHADSARAGLSRRPGYVALLVELPARGDFASVKNVRVAKDKGMGDKPIRIIVLGINARGATRIERVTGGAGSGHTFSSLALSAGSVRPSRLARSV